MARRKRKKPAYKQPQGFDSSFKKWICSRAQDILPVLVPGVKCTQMLDAEIIRSAMRADKVFKVLYDGKEHILHIEFQADEDDDLLSRLLVYNAVLYQDHKIPVLTLVIYPFKVKMAIPPLVIATSQKPILTFDFQIFPLFTMDAQTYVDQHLTCMYPLLPTMQGLHADMMTQVLQELSELYRNDETTLSQQYVWIKLLLERTGTIKPLEKDKIRERLNMFDKLWEESPTVQKMRAQDKAEGKLETSQSMLLNFVQVKFPDLTAFAQKQVKRCNKPETLESLFNKMLVAPDTTTVRQLLETLPKQ